MTMANPGAVVAITVDNGTLVMSAHQDGVHHSTQRAQETDVVQDGGQLGIYYAKKPTQKEVSTAPNGPKKMSLEWYHHHIQRISQEDVHHHVQRAN